MFTSCILVMTCFITPYHLAFYPQDQLSFFKFNSTLDCLESIIDIVFFVEIIVCFNTSVYEQSTNRYLTSRKDIARSYFKSWFWIDFIAILPRFLLIVEAWGQTLSYLKYVKIARIGRLIKLLKLLRMAKAIK